MANVGYALMWATLAPVVASAGQCSWSITRSTGAAFAPALPLPGFSMAKGWGWLPCSSSKQSGAAVSWVELRRSLWDGALGLEATGKEGQKKESKRRRMFRIGSYMYSYVCGCSYKFTCIDWRFSQPSSEGR